MIINLMAIYQDGWTGADSPLAYDAFTHGISSTIERLASALSDSPQSYEDAKSEQDWKDYLTQLLIDHPTNPNTSST